MRFILILIAALIWGVASWWWYTCKIKGFCGDEGAPVSATGAPVAQAPEISSKDSDGDGISDEMELKLGLDPNNKDSDGDGLYDVVELGGNPETPVDSDQDGIIDALDSDDDNDGISTKDEQADANGDGQPDDAVDTDSDGTPNYLDTDSDNDGVSDADEAKAGTDPLNADSDGDGLSDAEEIQHGTNSLEADTDGDGVSDADEIKNGTNPVSADSDGDGLSDGDEAKAGTDPLNADTDSDGLSDGEESVIGTNPTVTDTDGDGIDDKTEVGADLSTPLDTDGDGTIDALDTEDNSATEPKEAETADAKPDEVSVETAEAKPDDAASDVAPITSAKIYFPFRSADPQLSGSAKTYFGSVVDALKASPDQRIVLTGHTDNVGAEDANQKLGMKRAEVVKSILIKMGASADQIDVASDGEVAPIESNDTQEGRDRNRRVELSPK